MTNDPLELIDADDEPVDPNAGDYVDDRDDEPDVP
jgi:hypothetical protein